MGVEPAPGTLTGEPYGIGIWVKAYAPDPAGPGGGYSPAAFGSRTEPARAFSRCASSLERKNRQDGTGSKICQTAAERSHSSARLGSARLGSARLGSARLGSARLGSARLLIIAARGTGTVNLLVERPVRPCAGPPGSSCAAGGYGMLAAARARRPVRSRRPLAAWFPYAPSVSHHRPARAPAPRAQSPDFETLARTRTHRCPGLRTAPCIHTRHYQFLCVLYGLFSPDKVLSLCLLG